MPPRLRLIALLLALAGGPIVAQTPPPPDAARAAQLFQRLDANRDGKIDGAEAASEAGKRFLRMFDKNGDGGVTLEETRGQGGAPPSPPPTARPSPPKKSAAAGPLPEPPVCYDLDRMRAPVQNATPVAPFEIMDGLFYVGNTQVSAHLLKTTDGLILIDSTMPHEVGWLLDSIRKLGFDPREVKVVIGTHAAVDHTGGHWYFQKTFGAQTWLHELDVPSAMSAKCVDGAKVDLTQVQAFMAYPPFKTDRVLKGGETIEWGGRTLVIHHTPTGTPGTITLEIPLRDKSGKTLRAGLLGACAPRMTGFEDSIRRLKERDLSVWLAVHPSQNQTMEKAARLKDGGAPNPFIDPAGWTAFLDRLASFGSRGRQPRTKARPNP